MSFDQLIGQFHHVKCTHIQVQRHKKEIQSMFQTGPLAYDLKNGGTMGKPMGPATFEKVNSFSLMSQ